MSYTFTLKRVRLSSVISYERRQVFISCVFKSCRKTLSSAHSVSGKCTYGITHAPRVYFRSNHFSSLHSFLVTLYILLLPSMGHILSIALTQPFFSQLDSFLFNEGDNLKLYLWMKPLQSCVCRAFSTLTIGNVRKQMFPLRSKSHTLQRKVYILIFYCAAFLLYKTKLRLKM